MDSAAFLLLAFVNAVTLLQVWGTDNVTALYGEVIVIPCNGGAPAPADLMFVKWKYEKDDGTRGDLLIKQVSSVQATVQATDQYAQRVSIDANFSLLISQATLKDQKTFTCMVVSGSNLIEYPVSVLVYKIPSSVQIMDKSKVLQKDKPTMVGTCVAANANPATTFTWKKNGKPLLADGKAVVISSSIKLDPATGLSTTSSTLQYAASKEDFAAVFVCVSTHKLTNQEEELGPFPIYYPSEKVSLEIMSKGPIVEGDNVTLKCHADGNPPPSSFFFHIKGQKMPVVNSDNYTLTNISREAGGEYKCSLADNEKMEASQSIAVSYLDLSLTSSGKVVKALGDTFHVTIEKNASGDPEVSWTKGRLIPPTLCGQSPELNGVFGHAPKPLAEREKPPGSVFTLDRVVKNLSHLGSEGGIGGGGLFLPPPVNRSPLQRRSPQQPNQNGKAMEGVKKLQFSKLTYADAGVYVCEVSMTSLTRRQSFELVVEGKPMITSLTKDRADDADSKVLTCEAEGVPEPNFQWSVNSTGVKSSHTNSKVTHKITVTPSVNLTVTCRVSNKLGEDTMTINVSSVFKEKTDKRDSQEDSEDQAKLIVGVVVGLLVAAAIVGLIYWLYMKNSRQGSWKTGEKELGTSEESTKLEDNNHAV